MTNEDKKAAYKEMQKKTFANWINAKLKKYGYSEVKDVFDEFDDAEVLTNLLRALGRNPPEITNKNDFKIIKMENLVRVFNYMQNELHLELVNIGAEDLYEKNDKLILGLIWTIILRLSVKDAEFSEHIKAEVMKWAQDVTAEYDCVEIKDFGKSFENGLPFLCILDFYFPGLYNASEDTPKSTAKNIEKAMRFAKILGIEMLFDPDEFAQCEVVDDKCVFTYLLEYYLYFKNKGELIDTRRDIQTLLVNINTKVGLENEIKDLQSSVDVTAEEYVAQAEDLTVALTTLNDKLKKLLGTNKKLAYSHSELRVTEAKLNKVATENNFAMDSKQIAITEYKAAEGRLTKCIDEIDLNLLGSIADRIAQCEKRVIAESQTDLTKLDEQESNVNFKFSRKTFVSAAESLKLDKIDVARITNKKLDHLPEIMEVEEVTEHLKN